MAVGRHAAAAHPAVRGLLEHANPEVRCRALGILSEAGDRAVLPRVEALLRRPHPRGQDRGALLPLAPRRRGPALAPLGPRRLPRFLGARGGGGGARPAGRGSRRGGAAPLRVDGRGGGSGRAEDPPRGGPPGGEAAPAVRGGVATARRGRGRRGGEDRHPGRRAARSGAVRGPLLAQLGRPPSSRRPRSPSSRPATRPGARSAWPSPTRAATARSGARSRASSSASEPPEAASVLAEHLLEGDATLRLRTLVALVHIRDQHTDIELDPGALEAALGAEVLGHYRSYQILGHISSPRSRAGDRRAGPSRRHAGRARADLPPARPAPPPP